MPMQAVDTMLTLVGALAQQWMGVWLKPKGPSDDWLLQGLCAHLTNIFIGKYLGRNEILYRFDLICHAWLLNVCNRVLHAGVGC